MNPSQSPASQIAKFSQILAELETRLRLSYVKNPSHTPSWPICSRLLVQADLLGGLAGQWGLYDFARFASCVSSLAHLGLDDPELIPGSWSGGLERLVVLLDEMMVGLDADDQPADWLNDPRWARLASWFKNIDSPFLIMDEMEEIFLRWQNTWCDGSLESGQEAELQQQWTRLRKFGDALLGPSSSDPGEGFLRWK